MPTRRKAAGIAFALLALATLFALTLWSAAAARRNAAAGPALDPAWTAAQRAVASQALQTWRLEARGVGGPLRALVIADRVGEFQRRPGSCATPVPGAFHDAALYDYHVTVRGVGLFGLPLASARFSCGGLAWESG
jgi:hypothetical protein